jgi:L-alanine-DL-glutamate epimerase-like enolase superfamily enzyme
MGIGIYLQRHSPRRSGDLFARPSEEPGLGIDWNPEKLETYKVKS